MKLSEYSIKKPITTIMITLSVMVMGLISLSRLPLEYLPSVSFPFLAVNISYPSSSPEEVDRLITRPVEETLATLSGVVSFSSRSSSTGSSIRMEFPFGADMDLVSIQIRDRLGVREGTTRGAEIGSVATLDPARVMATTSGRPDC